MFTYFYWHICPVLIESGFSDLQQVYNKNLLNVFCLDHPALVRMVSSGTSLLNAAEALAVRVLWPDNLFKSIPTKSRTVFNHLDNVSRNVVARCHKWNKKFIPCSKTLFYGGIHEGEWQYTVACFQKQGVLSLVCFSKELYTMTHLSA